MTSNPTTYTLLESPHGPVVVAWKVQGLTHISFQDSKTPQLPDPTWQFVAEASHAAIDQLRAYFAGSLQTFGLPLAPQGTRFQQAVWEALQAIPYGETITYAELAQWIGRPSAVRAVGAANGKNPLPIVVPCHRVIGSNGTLTGYAGGVHLKAALLDHERTWSHKPGAQLSLL